jgi:hypothetical protein
MPFSNFSRGVLENFGGVRTPLHPPRKSAPVFKACGNPDITTIVCGRVINNTKPLQIKYNILEGNYLITFSSLGKCDSITNKCDSITITLKIQCFNIANISNYKLKYVFNVSIFMVSYFS